MTQFCNLVRQEIAFFDRTKTGELINRLSADTVLASEAISTQVSDGLRSSFMTGAGIAMMFYMSPQLALVSLSVVPPVAAYGVLMGRKVRNTSRNVQDALAESTQVAEERISNIRTVRTFAKEDDEINRYDTEMNKVLHAAKQEAKVQAQFYGFTGLSGNMIILTVLYYGGSLVTTDVITVGSLTSFILYAAYVGIGLSGISSSYAQTMKAVGASSRIWEITDKTPTMLVNDKEQFVPTEPLKGNIRFENVDFSYPLRKDLQIIKNLNLTVPSGSAIAVVGSSGSGKSTLGALLLRLYDLDQGIITIDGNDISKLNSTWLRTQIGTVSQEPVLFSSSISDNISYGAARNVAQNEIEAAAKEANAHDFILSFPEGYATKVGERGVLLSGGQKQRIAIARAILKNPQILLLDEATSALDTASEHQVKLALDGVMKGRSVIMIAHRLSTIKNANQIVVLEGGKIVEQGTYTELLKINNGRFKALIRK